MTTVGITGAAGFIGLNLIEHLLVTTDWRLVLIDRVAISSYPDFVKHAARIRIQSGDLSQFEFATLATEGCDVVIHLAAETHNDWSLRSPKAFVSSNIVGTFNVLESARINGFRLHHVSTDEVFGDLDEEEPPFTESSQYRPSSPYSATKASSDMLVRAWVRSFDVHATISNCSNNYGRWQHVEKFIPRQIARMLKDQEPIIYGTGSNIRDWIHVEDHVGAILEIVTRGESGQTYLVGTQNEMTNLSIVRALLEIFGEQDRNITFVEDRKGHDRRYSLSNAKIVRELNWQPPRRNMLDELGVLVEWYREHEAWWQESYVSAEERYSTLKKVADD